MRWRRSNADGRIFSILVAFRNTRFDCWAKRGHRQPKSDFGRSIKPLNITLCYNLARPAIALSRIRHAAHCVLTYSLLRYYCTTQPVRLRHACCPQIWRQSIEFQRSCAPTYNLIPPRNFQCGRAEHDELDTCAWHWTMEFVFRQCGKDFGCSAASTNSSIMFSNGEC